MLIIKSLFAILGQALIFGVLLIVPAGLLPEGTWLWHRAIYFCIGYFIFLVPVVIYIAKVAPGGLEARFKRAPKDEKRPKADKILLPLVSIAIVAIFLAIPFDRFYFQLLPMPDLTTSIVGVGLAMIGLLINSASLVANAYITPTIQDQTHEGQKVADTGVYGFVRHPMYTSLFMLFAGMALWLESWTAVLLNIPLLIVIIIRIIVEEKKLKETLPGYPAYMKKVKYRLLPFIW
ncbi:methyltransferase family protein [Patescibacteria group bacterium]